MRKLFLLSFTVLFLFGACSFSSQSPIVANPQPQVVEPLVKENSRFYDIYKESSYVQEPDSGTFEFIDTPSHEIQFARDYNHIYKFFLDTMTVTPYDPATFNIYPKDAIVVFDKNGTYINDSLVPNLDPATFHILGGENMGTSAFMKDKDFVRTTCCGYKILPQIDALTAELVGDNLIQDKNGIYNIDGEKVKE